MRFNFIVDLKGISNQLFKKIICYDFKGTYVNNKGDLCK